MDGEWYNNNNKKEENETKSLFYCCLHSNLHAVILQQNISLQILTERENVTQELEIFQSSAACSTTSSLGVVSNKVRLLEKKKKINKGWFLASFIPYENRNTCGRHAWDGHVCTPSLQNTELPVLWSLPSCAMGSVWILVKDGDSPWEALPKCTWALSMPWLRRSTNLTAHPGQSLICCDTAMHPVVE